MRIDDEGRKSQALDQLNHSLDLGSLPSWHIEMLYERYKNGEWGGGALLALPGLKHWLILSHFLNVVNFLQVLLAGWHKG